MCNSQSLSRKLHQALNVMICESKIARNYGTDHKLTYSDISLLKCVQRNEDTKASDLSQYLGITNGAVTQLAKKLEEKGYLRPYRMQGNKKEVYYKLTSSGEIACHGYDEHYKKMESNIEEYISKLDSDTVGKIDELFDLIVGSVPVHGYCSLRRDVDKAGHLQETAMKRCEKCQRVY